MNPMENNCIKETDVCAICVKAYEMRINLLK